jgi:hypothetical protein
MMLREFWKKQSDSENRLFDSDDNLRVLEDFSIYEGSATERSDTEDKDSVQDSASALHGGPSVRHLHGRSWLIMWGEKFSLYKPWRPLGLREVEAPTFSDIRLINGGKVCHPYALATFYSHKNSWYSFLLEAGSTPGP